jgi:hypothetical protein
MEIPMAERLVSDWASSNAGTMGTGPSRVQASYIYNPGGFGNLSFRLTDGRTRLHVKLAPPNKVARLQLWAGFSPYVAERYAAPKLICEIDREIANPEKYITF